MQPLAGYLIDRADRFMVTQLYQTGNTNSGTGAFEDISSFNLKSMMRVWPRAKLYHHWEENHFCGRLRGEMCQCSSDYAGGSKDLDAELATVEPGLRGGKGTVKASSCGRPFTGITNSLRLYDMDLLSFHQELRVSHRDTEATAMGLPVQMWAVTGAWRTG